MIRQPGDFDEPHHRARRPDQGERATVVGGGVGRGDEGPQPGGVDELHSAEIEPEFGTLVLGEGDTVSGLQAGTVLTFEVKASDNLALSYGIVIVR